MRLVYAIFRISSIKLFLFIIVLGVVGSFLEVLLFKSIGEYFTQDGLFLLDYRVVLSLVLMRLSLNVFQERVVSNFVWSHYRSVIQIFMENRLKRDLWYLKGVKQEYLLRIVTKDIPHIGFVVQAVLSLTTDSILILILLAYSFWLNLGLTLFILGVGFVLSFLLSKVLKNSINSSSEERKRADEELKGWLIGVHLSSLQLQSLNLLNSVITEMNNIVTARSRAGSTQSFLIHIPRLFVENGIFLLLVVIMALSSDSKNLLMVLPVLIRAVPSASRLNSSLSTIRFYYNEVLDVYKGLYLKTDALFDVSIRVKDYSEFLVLDVDYIRIAGHQNNLLSSVIYKFDKGRVNFLVGPSGSGKTTMLESLVITNLIENLDLKIALAQQEAVLFNRDVMFNLVFDCEINVSLVRDICNGLNISKELLNWNQEKDSISSSLSGGEKQRINLARCLLCFSDIYILDEPTNNLDDESKLFLMEFLSNLANKAIVICISHDTLFMDSFNSKRNIVNIYG